MHREPRENFENFSFPKIQVFSCCVSQLQGSANLPPINASLPASPQLAQQSQDLQVQCTAWLMMQLPRLRRCSAVTCFITVFGFYLECRRCKTRTSAKTSLRQKLLQLHVLASNAVGRLTSFPFNSAFRPLLPVSNTHFCQPCTQRVCGSSTRSLTGMSEGAVAAASDTA